MFASRDNTNESVCLLTPMTYRGEFSNHGWVACIVDDHMDLYMEHLFSCSMRMCTWRAGSIDAHAPAIVSSCAVTSGAGQPAGLPYFKTCYLQPGTQTRLIRSVARPVMIS